MHKKLRHAEIYVMCIAIKLEMMERGAGVV